MAALTPTTLQGKGSRLATGNTLTSSDTFTIEPAKKSWMLLQNPTGGTITPTLNSGLADFVLPEIALSVNASTGFSIAIDAGTWVILNLRESFNFLSGSCTITSGTGLKCFLFKE